MNADRVVVLEIARLEASHLAGLVTQFADLLRETGADRPDDPAVSRLVPDAYADDEVAAREFRELTQRELLDRRATDASIVLASLADAAVLPSDASTDSAEARRAMTEMTIVRLDDDSLQAWLRTLAAVRLVLASRLGITGEDDHDDDDPRFGIYDWLGFRLDGLVKAADAESWATDV